MLGLPSGAWSFSGVWPVTSKLAPRWPRACWVGKLCCQKAPRTPLGGQREEEEGRQASGGRGRGTRLTHALAVVPMLLGSALDTLPCSTGPGSACDCSATSTPSPSPHGTPRPSRALDLFSLSLPHGLPPVFPHPCLASLEMCLLSRFQAPPRTSRRLQWQDRLLKHSRDPQVMVCARGRWGLHAAKALGDVSRPAGSSASGERRTSEDRGPWRQEPPHTSTPLLTEHLPRADPTKMPCDLGAAPTLWGLSCRSGKSILARHEKPQRRPKGFLEEVALEDGLGVLSMSRWVQKKGSTKWGTESETGAQNTRSDSREPRHILNHRRDPARRQ